MNEPRGASDANSSQQPTEAHPSTQSTPAWITFLRSVDRWWAVLILLFCVTAVCGLPLLWISRSFRWPAKILITILVILYTAFLVYGVGWIVWWSYSRALDALN